MKNVIFAMVLFVSVLFMGCAPPPSMMNPPAFECSLPSGFIRYHRGDFLGGEPVFVGVRIDRPIDAEYTATEVLDQCDVEASYELPDYNDAGLPEGTEIVTVRMAANRFEQNRWAGFCTTVNRRGTFESTCSIRD